MRKRTILVAIPFVTLSACADFGSNYVPILDGAESAAYRTDLQSCQNLARGQSFGQDTVGAAAVGGVFGGIFADHALDSTTIEGALAGAIAGLLGGMIDESERRKSIVLECMKGRGHRIVG